MSCVVMPPCISLEEHLQELQWEQRKASNHSSENRAVADGATEARDERTVDLAAGRPSQHLLRSAGETNIPARGEAGRS